MRALERAGLDLFLAEGLERVTIDAVAERAGVAKGSFYRYYRDKEDLVEALLSPVATGIARATETCARNLARAESPQDLAAAYGALAAALAPIFLAHPDVVRLYLQECRGPAVGARRPIARLAGEIALGAVELTRVAHARGVFRPLDAEVTALAAVGAAERLLFAVLTREHRGDPLTVSQTLISVILDGMRRRA